MPPMANLPSLAIHFHSHPFHVGFNAFKGDILCIKSLFMYKDFAIQFCDIRTNRTFMTHYRHFEA